MKKISKKIVALATMAAFVLTLVPAAAFAAEYGSTVSVNEDYEQVTLADSTTGADIKATVDLVAEDATKANANGDKVYIWVTRDNIPYTSYVSYDGAAKYAASGNLNGVGAITVDADNAVSKDVTITVKNTGKYTVHAAIANSETPETFNDLTEIAAGERSVSEVVAAEAEINSIQVTTPVPSSQDAETGTITYSKTPNSIDAEKVVADVKGVLVSDGTTEADVDGQKVAIENANESEGLYVFKTDTEEALAEAEVDNGKISFDIKAMSGTKAGTYHIYLVAGSVEYDLSVVVGTSKVVSIDTVDTDNTVVNKDKVNFEGVAEFVFKDNAGNTVEQLSPLTYYVAKGPKNHGLDASTDFKLEKTDNNTYKLVLQNKSKLVAGDYTIRVAIPSGDSAEVSFTAKKAGKTVGLEIVPEADTVVLNGTVTGVVYAVDENGIKTPAKNADVKLGFVNSTAADVAASDIDLGTDGKFSIKANENEKYIGSKIVLLAFDQKAKVQDKVELTVVDGLSNNTLAFDNEAGVVEKNNTVKVSVVDENGKAVSITGKAYAYVESASNEDAKVTVKFPNNTVTKGNVNMTVYSTKETTADIVVAVQDDTTHAIYANTLTYTFGEQDIPADTTVVMTVGSSDFVVNNEVVTKEDAAPYVANDRTYVPFRALGEALGAEVVWDNDARTVTYTLGKTEVVMTIGEKTYTVNDEEKTMDVAPVITGDRTYVPVRFVGEALGFNVTALSNTDGTTASVVFQK